MNTLQLTDDELRLVRSALEAYLEEFGHDEGDVVQAIKLVMAKIPPVPGRARHRYR